MEGTGSDRITNDKLLLCHMVSFDTSHRYGNYPCFMGSPVVLTKNLLLSTAIPQYSQPFCPPMIHRITYMCQVPPLPLDLQGEAELPWLMNSNQLCFIQQYISRGGHSTWNNTMLSVLFCFVLIYAIFSIQVNRK